MLAAIEARILYPAILVNLGFSSGTLYVWSGIGSITWNGNTYTGIGQFGGFSTIEEGASVEARGLTLKLSGVDSTALADALQNLQLGLPVTIYLALLTGPAGTIIADPIISWQGRMDQPDIFVSGATSTISLKCESRILDMNVPTDRRLTQEDLNLLTPGDLGCSFVYSIMEVSVYWGSSPTSTQNI